MAAAEPGARGPRSRVERWGVSMGDLGRDFVRSMSTRMLSPRGLLAGAMGAAQASASALSALLPASRSSDALLETANKLRAYRLFACADTLALEPGSGWEMAAESLRGMDPFSSVWVTEGLGYYLAQRGVLAEPLSDRMWVPMHTGLGLSLAERALRSVRDLPGALRTYRQDAWDAARPGFGEVVYEALGLIAVTLFPDFVGPIDRELSGNEQLCGLFWHGVGRGLYFLPLHFLPAPWARERPVQYAAEAPSTAVGRVNALAGLAWAMTLVNVQDPEVIAQCLGEYARAAPEKGVLRNGVASALVVWMASAPEERSVDLLAQFEPPPESAALWDGTMRGAIADARRLGGSPATAATVFRVRFLE